jgi:hypothetical protein
MSSQFLECFKVLRLTDPGKALFEIVPEGEKEFEYCLIGDPSLDRTFRRMFCIDHEVNGITGRDRIMLFYPDRKSVV